MAGFGLALLPLVGLGLVLTGWPAFAVLIAAAGIGGMASMLGGGARYLTALPSRVVGLLESDILQALPLFVLMGALLNRLPLVDILFRTIVGILGRRPSSPRVASLLIGALLAPMSGSVGASVSMLSRTIGPRLGRFGIPRDEGFAVVAVASTLGVVVPPSLVLILLGDAMMSAHTLALNVSGRSARVLNTHDIFAAALGPAAMFLGLAIAIAALHRTGEGDPSRAGRIEPLPVTVMDILVSGATVGFILLVLGGVALGWFYAVEAAAFGGVVLLSGGLATRRIDGSALAAVMSETLAITGALFALLLAATTFTLVLRGLGSDRLLLDFISGMPAGNGVATFVTLAILAASALVLDAFEILFVVIPLLMPGLLARVEDASWVSALTLITLQVSFLLPPLGYAATMARAAIAPDLPVRRLVASLAPYLAAAGFVLACTSAFPPLAHVGEVGRPAQGAAPLSDRDVIRRFDELAPEAPPPLALPD